MAPWSAYVSTLPRRPPPAPAVAPGPAPAPLTPAGITHLQRTIGNAAVGRLVLQREPTAEQQTEAQMKWQRSGDAASLIRKHNFLGIPAWLRIDALASELLDRLPADWELAIECLSQLVQGHQDNDLAVALTKNASDDKLKTIASDPGGAKLMFRIVGAMQGLTTSEAEKAQLYRAMTAITRSRGSVADRRRGDHVPQRLRPARRARRARLSARAPRATPP